MKIRLLLKGDKVLVEVSGKIDQAINSQTSLQSGWREFIICCLDTLAGGGNLKADGETNFEKQFGRVAIHCSFGAASLEPGETEEDFLNRVDGLLYEAKRKGKNQVSY